jgi:hypothetical protein
MLKPTEKATTRFRAQVQAAKDGMIEEKKARFAMHEDDLERFMKNHFKVICTGVPRCLLSMEMCWLPEKTTLHRKPIFEKI